MSSKHEHSRQELVLLDDDGRDSGDRLLYCTSCNTRLGIKKALPLKWPLHPDLILL